MSEQDLLDCAARLMALLEEFNRKLDKFMAELK